MLQFGADVRRAIGELPVAVVVANQITQRAVHAAAAQQRDDSEGKAPALGLAWSSVINARYMLRLQRGVATAHYARAGHDDDDDDDDASRCCNGDDGVRVSTSRRTAQVAFSPWGPAAGTRVEYVIARNGVRGTASEADDGDDGDSTPR